MIASGALREKVNNPNYYQYLLCKYPRDVTFPFDEAIDLDLHRTFPEVEYYKNEENLQKLKRVLIAFAMRNLSIGYCQGFNYIVGKILLFTRNEEDAFWIFVRMVEHYVPFTFYLKFIDVRTHTELLKKLVTQAFGEMFYQMDDNSLLCISNLGTRCLISLFSQNVKDKILFCIWDAFFVYGSITLYNTFLWAVYNFFDRENDGDDGVENMHADINKKLSSTEDTDSLCYFLFLFKKFNQKYIDDYTIKNSHITIKNSYFNTEDVSKLAKKCNVKMPFCLCNKDGESVKNIEKFRNYFTYRSNYKVEFIDDYFYGENSEMFNERVEKDEGRVLMEDEVSIDDLCIERQNHECLQYLNNNSVNNINNNNNSDDEDKNNKKKKKK